MALKPVTVTKVPAAPVRTLTIKKPLKPQVLAPPPPATNNFLSQVSHFTPDQGWVPNVPPAIYTQPGVPSDTGGGGGASGAADTFNPNNWALGEYMNDPRFGDASKLFSARTTAARGALRNALRSAVIGGGWGDLNLGANPALSGYAGDIDQETLSAAAANPMSQRAQLQGQLDRAQADIPWRLTSRGAAESGAAGVAAQTNQDQFKNASYNAMQDLLGGLSGNLSDYGQQTTAAENTFNSSVNDLINSLAGIAAGQHAATNARGYTLPAEQQPVYTSPAAPKATVSEGTGTPSAKTVANIKKMQAAKQKAALPAQRNAALALSGVLGTRY